MERPSPLSHSEASGTSESPGNKTSVEDETVCVCVCVYVWYVCMCACVNVCATILYALLQS